MTGTNKKGFRLKVIPVLLLLMFLSSGANAIVSMESVHLGKPPQGFTGAFELGADADYGNTEEVSASTAVKLQWSEDKTTDFALVNYAYGESAGVRNKNNAFVHLRHIQQFRRQTAWEVFSQFSSDEFTRLNLRALVGGGARLTLGTMTGQRAIYLGLGGFYEHEKLDVNGSPAIDETEETVRGSTYLILKYQFNTNVSLVSSTYYQPALDDLSDFRATENASLVSKLTDDLSFKAGLNIRHDSEPPPDVDKTDTSISIGFSVNF